MNQQAVATDPFARALLPVLLHEMNNVTQALTMAQALLQPSSAPISTRVDLAGLFAEETRRIEDLGWALAVLSSAVGADLVLARRTERDAQILIGCARSVVRRTGRDFDCAPARGLCCAPNVGRGWELSWSLATWLWACSSSTPQGSSLAWSVHHAEGRTVVNARASRAAGSAGVLDEAAQRIRTWLPEIEARIQGEEASLCLPSGYVHVANSKHEAERA